MTQYWNPEWKTDTMAEYAMGALVAPAKDPVETLPSWVVHTSIPGVGPYIWKGAKPAGGAELIESRNVVFLECERGTLVNVQHIVAFVPTGY